MNEWGIPDWADAAAYGDTSKWRDLHWHWQFTRRREDYRADFDAGLPKELERRAGEPKDQLDPTRPYFTVLPPHRLVDKYGLTPWPNPRCAELERFTLMGCRHNWPVGVAWYQVGSGQRLDSDVETLELPEKMAAAVFDLSKPIDRQWKELRAYILRSQEQVTGKVAASRKHPELWLTYLRVLDGRETGAPWREIFEVVLREKKSSNLNPVQEARGVWQRARDLMFNWRD